VAFVVTKGAEVPAYFLQPKGIRPRPPASAADWPLAGGFGQISAARGSDFGGYRTGQVFLRLDF